MLQIVTEFCLLHLTASHAGCKYFFLSSKVHAENFSRWYICVCIATAVDFSIQVQMNQWKIVWLPVWMNLCIIRSCIVFSQSTEEEDEAGVLVDHLDTTTTRYKMGIGPDKTKVMTNNPNGFQREIKIKGQRLEEVENFKYLGAIISHEGSKPKILSRIAQTTAAFSRLKIIRSDKNTRLLLRVSWCGCSSYLPSFMPVRAGSWQQKSREGSKPLRWDAIGDFWTFPTKTMWRTRRFATESRMQLECMMIS